MASLPYPRSQPNYLPTEPTEPTEVSDARLFSHRLHGCAQIRRVWHPAIPTQPPNYLPTEPTEPTEVSGARYSPTDFTDVHRLGGYGIPAIPTQPQNYLPTEPYAAKPSVSIRGRLFSTRNFREFRGFRGRITMLVHECSVGAAETAAPPGRAAWVWQGCHTLLR